MTEKRKAPGKAGQYFVLSELIFRGYNGAELPVDEGIDIIAMKDGKTVYLQVKTCTTPRFSPKAKKYKYKFKLNFSAFGPEKKRRDLFYVFVLRREHEIKAIILDYARITDQIIHQNVSSHVSRNVENVDVFIQEYPDSSRYYLYFSGIGRGQEDMKLNVTMFLNKWDEVYI